MTVATSELRLPPETGEVFDVRFPEHAPERLARLFARHGSVFRMRSNARPDPVYVLADPDAVRHVLVTGHRNYTKGFGIERVRLLLGNGIMVSEGELWSRQRRMVQPAFQRHELAGFVDGMRRRTEALVAEWAGAARAGRRVNVTEALSDVTLGIVLEAVLGEDLQRLGATDAEHPFAVVARETARDLGFARRFRALAGVVRDVVRARRGAGEAGDGRPRDLLGAMMAARDKATGAPMGEREIVDEVLTLIVAGHETTASALNWAWYLLARHPQAQARLHEEVDALTVDAPSARLLALAWPRQVLQEAMRLYPPGWMFTRRAIGPDRVCGFDVPAGTDVLVCAWLVHRHPEIWDDPEAFRPERFAPAAVAARPRFSYLPFAAGPRHCVGEHFAMVEMQLHLALVARRLRLVDESPAPAAVAPHINLRMKEPRFMRPRLR